MTYKGCLFRTVCIMGSAFTIVGSGRRGVRNYRTRWGLATLTAMSAASLFAQAPDAGYVPTAVQQGTPQGSYALSNLFTINYLTGRMNFLIPLVKVGGRGEAGMTVNAGLSSDWEITAQTIYSQNCENGGPCTVYTPTIQTLPASVTGRTEYNSAQVR